MREPSVWREDAPRQGVAREGAAPRDGVPENLAPEELAREALVREVRELRERLEVAEETLRAIRCNEVDALVVGPQGGEQVFTLRGADESYRVFVEVMPLAAATVSADGTILYCNRAFAALLRVPLERVIGASVYGFVGGVDEGHLRALLWEALAGGPVERQFCLCRPDGARVPTILTAAPLSVDGAPAACVVATDVTEHEARVAAEAANRAKDRFLAVLSHELRTPLTPVVMSVAALAADPALPAQVREDLAMVRRNIELETRLIDDLLDLSRITSGKLRVGAERVGVHGLVRSTVDILRSDALRKGIDCRLDLAAAADVVCADPGRLQQVFWNLLRNAIKFSEAGGEVTVRSRTGPAGEVVVEVRDQGIGIDPAALPRVFDAFEQGGQDERPRAGGLGLGLTIAKAIVDLHGGTIRAESGGRGRGAAFVVALPPAAPQSGPPPPAAGGNGAARPGDDGRGAEAVCQPLHILLVEDHPETALILGRLLRQSGHRVETAGDVASALRLAAAQPFDLLLSDVGLPDASGYDLMGRVRQLYGTPGIALSGYGMEDDLRRSHEAGFADHVTKPVNFQELQAVIARVVGAAGTAATAAARPARCE